MNPKIARPRRSRTHCPIEKDKRRKETYQARSRRTKGDGGDDGLVIGAGLRSLNVVSLDAVATLHRRLSTDVGDPSSGRLSAFQRLPERAEAMSFSFFSKESEKKRFFRRQKVNADAEGCSTSVFRYVAPNNSPFNRRLRRGREGARLDAGQLLQVCFVAPLSAAKGKRRARNRRERDKGKENSSSHHSLTLFSTLTSIPQHSFSFSFPFPRPGDHIHLIHVIPRLQLAAVFGAPPVDFLPQQVRVLKTCFFFLPSPFPSALKKTRPLSPPSFSLSPLPQQDPAAYEQLIKNAEHFVSQRFLPRLLSVSPDPVVHLVKAEVDADSIGSVVCRKAADLKAAALVMASHTKTKLQEFFLGSVTNYCCHHCGCPVLVVK